MCTRSSSNLHVVSPLNPSTSNPKRRNCRRSKQPFNLEESPIDTMADQGTMAELLRAPAEGYAEAIVVPSILAEQFELKHSLINICLRTSGNLLERRTQDVLTIIKNKSKVLNSQNKSIISQLKSCDANSNSFSSEIAKLTHAVNQQMSDVTTAMTAILKQFKATPHPASVKSVEEICVTCDGAHPYYQCLAVGGNTFPELMDNIQGYVSAAAVNYNQGNSVYLPPGMANQIRPPGFAQPNGELKVITTRSGIVLDGPTIPTPPPFINPKVDERVEETLTDQDLSEYTIKVLPLHVQKYKPPSQRDFVVHPRVPFILGRPFLRTARALIDVYGEEMILCDGDERLTLNMRHDTSSYSNQP
nr:reverse transcriptase domain-containing protein [Tanacetum cinerariifolium]